MARIFISYKRVDKDKVFPIVEEIKRNTGVDCWIDLEGIEGGDQFQNVIIDAIDNADIVVFMLSKNFIAPYKDEKTGKIDLKKQTFIEREVMYAFRHNKRLVPLSIDGTAVSDCKWLEFNCSGLDCIDWNKFEQHGKFLNNLRKWNDETIIKHDYHISLKENVSCKYKFVAYFSFCRQDLKVAEILYKKIENFKYGNNGDCPLRPLYLDVRDFAPGDYNKTIEEFLAQSHYLIIICSPKAAKNTWVNKEIEAFLKKGKEDYICPIIIDGEPYSNDENECYPPALKKHFKEGPDKSHGILGLDASNFLNRTRLEKDVIITKLALYLLDVTFDDIWRYRRQTLKIRLLRFFEKIR